MAKELGVVLKELPLGTYGCRYYLYISSDERKTFRPNDAFTLTETETNTMATVPNGISVSV